jgi:hypothetical protein
LASTYSQLKVPVQPLKSFWKLCASCTTWVEARANGAEVSSSAPKVDRWIESATGAPAIVAVANTGP